MPLHRPALSAAAGLLLASLAACAGSGGVNNPGLSPAAEGVAFMRGCWISRIPADGPNPQTTTVRLLPSRTGAAKLEGELLAYNRLPNGEPLSTPLTVDLDGKHASRGTETLAAASSPTFLAPPDKGWTRTTFASAPPKTDPDEMMRDERDIRWLIIEGDGDHLKLSSGSSQGLMSGVSFDFEGARDGCD